MTGWADEEPPGGVLFFSEGGMKTVFVAAQRANLELISYRDPVNLFGHRCPLEERAQCLISLCPPLK